MDSIWKNFLPSIIYRKTRSDEPCTPVYGVKLEAKKRGCKKCKRRRRLRERRKRGDRGDDLIDDLGNYLRAFVYSFFFFFHPFRSFASSLPRVSPYCPERGIVFHPPPLLCPQSPPPFTRCSPVPRDRSAHTHAFSRHFLLSPPPPGRITSAGSIFSNGWTSSHVHSPVTTGPCSLIKNNRQATRELFLVVAIRSTVLFLVSNRWRPNCWIKRKGLDEVANDASCGGTSGRGRRIKRGWSKLLYVCRLWLDWKLKGYIKNNEIEIRKIWKWQDWRITLFI